MCFDEKDGELFAKHFKGQSLLQHNEFLLKKSNQITETLKELHLAYDDKKYGVFGGVIRGYYSLYLAKIWSSNFIPEIMLGPKCYQTKSELKNFLTSNGLNKTKILLSDIPVR